MGKGVPLHAVPTRLPSFSESACRLADAPAPVQRQYPTRDIAMEAAMWPIANLRHMPMLHGIEVNVIDMTLQVGIVANGVLPKTTLPNSPLASGDLAGAAPHVAGQTARIRF